MKNVFKYIGSAACCSLVLFGASSCNDEFLEVDHYDIIDMGALYQNDENAKMGMTGIYNWMVPDPTDGTSYDGDWGFKPNLFTGCHPTMDTYATGWDKDWTVQNWSAETTELNAGWSHVYHAISLANEFLDGLQDADRLSPDVKNKLTGEARAARGFFYTWLAQTFGRVPMLATGESYSTHPQKAKAETYAEMWNFIIEDFAAAADLLDWKPLDGEYGRCTKGMALAYLGDAYMWKAYRCPEEAAANYQKAYDVFKKILAEGPYKLSASFTTNWDPAGVWNDEAIWVEQLDEGTNWAQWSDRTASMFTKFYTACPENGGWGSLYLPWEWYSCYESGDKRRDASCVTGAVPEADLKKYGIEKSDYVYGYHPYLQDTIGKLDGSTLTKQFHFNNGEYAPSIWSMKLWRTASAADAHKPWEENIWSTTPIYWKRLPNVMLDLAECCFNLGKDAEGWEQINTLRNRAWGNLEVGQSAQLTSKFLPFYNKLAKLNGTAELKSYPLPFNESEVTVPDAQTYYTKYAADKGFTSPVWKVAVNTERRKEFNCEWCLCPDMHKSGFLEDHIAHNYPVDNTEGDALTNYPWTPRTYVYSEQKMDMPIPSDELLKNKLCEQNPGY